MLVTLLVAVGVDLLWGEPPARVHPVVWMGKVIGALEQCAPDGTTARLAYGGGMVTACVALFTVPAWLLERTLRGRGLAGAVALGLCLKPAFAASELLRAAKRVGDALQANDLVAARDGLRSLVSRDASVLPAPLLAAAAVESVAENLSDSVVAPLCYWALWGLPGAIAYRAVNTLDAMIGYRTCRYEHLGKAAARLDDLANLPPARLAALLLIAAAPYVGGSPREAWRAMWRDHRATASPNAGWLMSAAAGALGIQLEKVDHYRLNATGRLPEAGDVARAVALVQAALTLAGPLLAGVVTWRARFVTEDLTPCPPSRSGKGGRWPKAVAFGPRKLGMGHGDAG